MIRALLLIVNPIPSWERVVEARRGIMAILVISLLPLLLLAMAGECYGLVHWGKQRGEFGRPVMLALPLALQYGIVQILVNLVVIFIGAYLVKAVGDTFHGRHTYTQAFTVVAYGLSPYFLMRLLNALSREPWWLTWVIGILLSLSVLYIGLPHVMRPDPAHALGFYFMSALLLVLLTGMASFWGYMMLEHHFSMIANLPPATLTPAAAP
jgi:hypothetical protein